MLVQLVYTQRNMFFGAEFEYVSKYAMSLLLAGRTNTYCAHTHASVCRSGSGRNCWDGVMTFIHHMRLVQCLYVERGYMFSEFVETVRYTVRCWPLRGVMREI